MGHELGQLSFQQAKALLCMHCEGCHGLQYLYFELCLTRTKVQLELLWHPSREGGGRIGALLCFLLLEK